GDLDAEAVVPLPALLRRRGLGAVLQLLRGLHDLRVGRGADPPGAGERTGDGGRGDARLLGDVVDRHALVRHSAGSVPRLLGTALTGRSPFPGATPEGRSTRCHRASLPRQEGNQRQPSVGERGREVSPAGRGPPRASPRSSRGTPRWAARRRSGCRRGRTTGVAAVSSAGGSPEGRSLSTAAMSRAVTARIAAGPALRRRPRGRVT